MVSHLRVSIYVQVKINQSDLMLAIDGFMQPMLAAVKTVAHMNVMKTYKVGYSILCVCV